MAGTSPVGAAGRAVEEVVQSLAMRCEFSLRGADASNGASDGFESLRYPLRAERAFAGSLLGVMLAMPFDSAAGAFAALAA
jgi:hypothetical protein